MLEFLKRLFNPNAKDGLEQTQREAYIDALVWVMYRDKSLSLGEEEILKHETESLSWESSILLEDYINDTINKTRLVIGDKFASERLLDDIALRLGTAQMRDRAVENCRRIAQSDGDLHQDEATFIENLKQRFDAFN